MSEQPLSFLFVANTPRDPLAGASGADISLIEALRDRGHQVDEIWADDMPRRIAHPNLHQLLELPRNFARAVASKCESKNYDVIQVNQPHAWLAAKQHRLSGRPGIFLNRSHGWEPALRKAVAKYGSISNDTRAGYRRFLSRLISVPLERQNKKVAQWSDGLVLASENDSDYVLHEYFVSRARVHAVTPGVENVFLESPINANNLRWKAVLYVGNFCSPKAPELVAKIFCEIHRTLPDVKLTWITAIQSHSNIKRLLGPAVEAVALLDSMDRPALIAQFDSHGIFILPSHFEGFGLVFLEAMARGLCVIGTPTGGMKSLIDHGRNGFLVDHNNHHEIVECVMKLRANSSLATQVAAEARLFALQFSWAITAERYELFCRQLLFKNRFLTSK